MQLTSFSDFAFRTLVYLAIQGEKNASTSEMADALCASRHHLTKVVQELNRMGLVISHRGASGGVTLSRDPKTINLGEIFDHLEAQKPLVECFNPVDNTCPILPVCRLKGILREAQQAFRNTLDRYTLADLLKNPEELRFYLG
jgi:Rrf2 family transcriptional regulator, nitric oxide-sensitive transcriptional repressor